MSTVRPLSYLWFRALALSLRGHLHGAKRTVQLAVLPLVFSAIGLLFILFLAHLGNIRLGDGAQEDAPHIKTVTFGSRVALELARSFDKDEASEDQSRALSGQAFSVQASRAQRQWAATALESAGAKIVPDPHADFKLVYENGQWTLSAKDHVKALIVWSSLQDALETTNPEKPNVSMGEMVSIKSEKKMASAMGKARSETAEFIPRAMVFVLIVPLMLAVWMSCAKACQDIDRARATGLLEAFVLSPMPFHIYLLGQAITQGMVVALVVAAILMLSGLFVGLMHPASLVFVVLIFFFVTTSLSMLGNLQVLWFHHRFSRVVGSMLLNPLASPLLLVIIMMFTSKDSTATSAASALSSIPLLGLTPSASASWLAVTVVASVAFVALLCVILEARLGPRRTGLSRL